MKYKKLFYEVLFTILAFIAITLAILDLNGTIQLAPGSDLYYIDFAILVIFVVDYFARLYYSEDKIKFFKQNIPDLIAIIPFNAMFKAFRVVKLVRVAKLSKATRFFKLSRLLGIIGKFHRNSKRFLHTNGLIYSLYFSIFVILMGALGISLVEQRSFSDSVWWAFVTATTVGYGDISPVTGIGRIIAGILMLVGIGTIGMITGTVATFFLSNFEQASTDYPFEKYINETTDFNEEEKRMLVEYAIFIKSRRKTK